MSRQICPINDFRRSNLTLTPKYRIFVSLVYARKMKQSFEIACSFPPPPYRVWISRNRAGFFIFTMNNNRKPHVALYGNIKLTRAYCDVCEGMSFVVDGKFRCCDRKYEEVPQKVKRIFEPIQRRHLPSKHDRQEILERQNYCCLYCERRFDTIVWRKNKPIKLRLNWDHVIPFKHDQNNYTENFVAACHVCNGIKSDFYFENLEAAQIFIRNRIIEKGYSDKEPTLYR